MNESILASIKKLLGLTEEYEVFDNDVIIHINIVLSLLHQLGVGPDKGFRIQDETAKWSDYVGDDPRLEMVKEYVYLKVRLLFDPPTMSSVLESYKQVISELEHRIVVAIDEIKAEEVKNQNE